MPTIIDSLIVKLGLDSKDVDSKTPSVDRKLKDIEKGASKTEDSFKQLSKSVAAFLAIIGGTTALKSFILQTIESSAALDRLSKNLNLSVDTLSAWGNAVEELGGSAKGLQGTMDMLSRSQTELRLTGQSSLIPYLSALGISLATVEGQAKPVDELLLELADRFSRMDRTTANNMGRMMGIDQDTMNLLLQGRRELELTIRRQKEHNAVTKQQAEQAAKLQRQLADTRQSFTALGRSLLEQATPYLEKFLEKLIAFGDWLNENREFVKDFALILGSIAAGFALISAATSPITLTVAAVVALAGAIALLWQDYQTWKRGGDSFIDWGKWEPAITGATNGIKMLAGALESAFNWYTKLYERITGHSFKNDFGAGVDAVKGFLGVKPVQPQMNSRAAGNISGAQIKKYFTDRGWTNEQAAGIAANVMSESGGNMRESGDNGKAFGLAQWHSDRQAAFARWAGHDIRTATLEEQLGFIQYELTQGSESAAGNALRGAKTANEAGSILSKRYERPADVEGEALRRGNLAQTLAGVKGASAALASAGNARGGATVDDHSVETHIGEIKVITAATDANGIARDLGKSMNYLFASQANSGLN